MSIETKWVRHGEGERYLGFTARVERAALPLPAVIVIQEAGGVNAHIEDVTRRIAAAGYFAFAPDLFSVDGVRHPVLARERMNELGAFINSLPLGSAGDPAVRAQGLSRLPEAEAGRVQETFDHLFTGGALELEQYLPQLHATLRFLRTENEATRGQKLGVMGFCMGGGLAALLACHDPELAAAAIFYGWAPPSSLVAGIGCPVAGFYGSADPRVNDGIPGFVDAMKRAGKSLEVHMYEGAGHAFFNDERNSYHAAATRDSYARVLELFRRQLA